LRQLRVPRGDGMSFVSALPLLDTLAYWWRKLAGEPGRPWFMALKMIEVSAFLDNRLRHSGAGDHAPVRAFLADRPPNAVPADPSVVVVVPAYCRSREDDQRIRALLDALASQTRGCRALLVDDGSPLRVAARGVEVLRLDGNRGPAAARNCGLARALQLRANVVALTDSDCVPDRGWIEELVSAFRAERRAHAISGATWSLDRSRLGRYHERNGTLNGRQLRGGARLLYGPTCNLALTAELARSIRFDETFRTAAAEDIDFCFRANKSGWAIYHGPRAVVRHDFGYDGPGALASIRKFWRQFRRYARGERQLLRKHPTYCRVFADSAELALMVSGSQLPEDAGAGDSRLPLGQACAARD